MDNHRLNSLLLAQCFLLPYDRKEIENLLIEGADPNLKFENTNAFMGIFELLIKEASREYDLLSEEEKRDLNLEPEETKILFSRNKRFYKLLNEMDEILKIFKDNGYILNCQETISSLIINLMGDGNCVYVKSFFTKTIVNILVDNGLSFKSKNVLGIISKEIDSNRATFYEEPFLYFMSLLIQHGMEYSPSAQSAPFFSLLKRIPLSTVNTLMGKLSDLNMQTEEQMRQESFACLWFSKSNGMQEHTEESNIAMLEFLQEKGCDIKKTYSKKEIENPSLLYIAFKNKSIELIKALKKLNFSFSPIEDIKKSEENHLLFWLDHASERNNDDFLSLIDCLSSGNFLKNTFINARNQKNNGRTILHNICYGWKRDKDLDSFIKILKTLFRKGADPNIFDSPTYGGEKKTPYNCFTFSFTESDDYETKKKVVHELFCNYGYKEDPESVIKFLINAPIEDLNKSFKEKEEGCFPINIAMQPSGITALMLCHKEENEKWLLEHGADPLSEDMNGLTYEVYKREREKKKQFAIMQSK